MIRTDRRRWATALVCLLVAAAVIVVLKASTTPAADTTQPLDRAGSAVGVDLTITPPTPPTTAPAPEFTAAELRYLQLLHDQTEFEGEYADDSAMVVIGTGMCWSIDAGQTVPELIDYLDNRGYTYLAAAWIVGSALQELCLSGGGR